jgi:hypothetical protein
MIPWIALNLPLLAQASPLYSENIPLQWMNQAYRFSHQVGLRFSPALGKRQGLDYRLTYSLGPSAVDFQVTYLSSKWSALSVPGSDSDFDVINDPGQVSTDPNAEINRARSASDSWTQWIYELGYSYRGRLIPLESRKWMQSARFALGYTRLKDLTHGLSYSGASISTDFMIGYSILPKVILGPSLGIRSGWAYLDGVPASSATQIPLLSLEMTLGAQIRI